MLSSQMYPLSNIHNKQLIKKKARLKNDTAKKQNLMDQRLHLGLNNIISENKKQAFEIFVCHTSAADM